MEIVLKTFESVIQIISRFRNKKRSSHVRIGSHCKQQRASAHTNGDNTHLEFLNGWKQIPGRPGTTTTVFVGP